MSYRSPQKKVARIRIAGPDQKGIIALTTSFLFENSCNIEDIDQRILDDYLIMNMLVDMTTLKHPLPVFLKALQKIASSVGCEATYKAEDKKAVKNVALLVTKESHCFLDLMKNLKGAKSKGKPVVVIGNQPDLKELAAQHKLPFYYVPSDKKKVHEQKVLNLLKDYEIDLIVLARYMQILSPEFVFRHEGKIINIHPSLLPAFPGPRSYHQAFNKGVEVVGVTSHFVTTNLDEGPIICQESFRVDKSRDTVEKMIEKGRKLEATCLTRAVKLFLEDRLLLRRDKVIDNKDLNQKQKRTLDSYQLN